MGGQARMTISGVHIDKLIPTHSEGSIGHTFELRATLNVAKRKAGPVSGLDIDYPELEWNESIDWFERLPDGSWKYVGTQQTNHLYKDKPTSNTFRFWHKSRFFIASDPSMYPPKGLVHAVLKANGDMEEKDKAARDWIAENGFQWTMPVAHDKPALGLNPMEDSGGRGGESLVTHNSRRRVIHFDLGFEGSPGRIKATQILETVNGKPTIHKYFAPPGISKAEANDPKNLATWRT